MSKQDTHFFNVFNVVLGLLVAFAILVFALARYVGKHEQNAQVLKEPTPSCHITAFGATALEYVLWAWISSASEGPTRVRSAIMIAMWDTFERQGVTIPKPGPAHIVLDKGP